jgi:hypothetical protein
MIVCYSTWEIRKPLDESTNYSLGKKRNVLPSDSTAIAVALSTILFRMACFAIHDQIFLCQCGRIKYFSTVNAF